MPLPKVQTSITLFGSMPWGFRISGGKEFNQPLVITRVTPGSLAAKSGVQSGDVVVAISNQYVSNLSQDECEAKVRQAVGSLHLVLEKNAAKVTELPGGQVTVEGDRSIYTATKDMQQRISKYNRSAKPFGAPDEDTPKSEDKSADVKSSGYRPISFRPKPQGTPSPPTETTLPTSARGAPDGVSSTTESLSQVTLQDKGESTAPPQYNLSSYNRKPAPFSAGNASNNSNAPPTHAEDDFPPPPPDFIESPQEPVSTNGRFVTHVKINSQPVLNPSVINAAAKKKIVVGSNTPLGLYSQQNAEMSYQAQVGDL